MNHLISSVKINNSPAFKVLSHYKCRVARVKDGLREDQLVAKIEFREVITPLFPEKCDGVFPGTMGRGDFFHFQSAEGFRDIPDFPFSLASQVESPSYQGYSFSGEDFGHLSDDEADSRVGATGQQPYLLPLTITSACSYKGVPL